MKNPKVADTRSRITITITPDTRKVLDCLYAHYLKLGKKKTYSELITLMVLMFDRSIGNVALRSRTRSTLED
jgi:hypothetical protein